MSALDREEQWGAFCLLWIDVVQHESAVTLEDEKTCWIILDDVVRGDDEQALCRRAYEEIAEHSRLALWMWLHRELEQHIFIHALAIGAVDDVVNLDR